MHCKAKFFPVAFFMCWIPISLSAAGLAIWPMEQYASPAKSVTYVASNQNDKAVAVEVICETWTISEQGEEIREVSNDLVAYPSQFILKGNTFRRVKVGLRKPLARIDNERCYRVTIRELPISLDPEEPGTYRIYQASAYRTSFYLRPPNPQAQVALVAGKWEVGQLTLAFQNQGNAHAHLRNPSLTVETADGERIEITDKQTLASIAGHNMHAGITRRFTFPLPQLMDRKIVGGTVQFQDQGVLQGQTFSFKL